MFFFFFTKRYGFDRVVYINGGEAKSGDIVVCGGEYALCLGKKIAFQELYTYTSSEKYDLVEKKVLSSKAMKYLHIFVGYRFTTYKSAVPLWLGPDIPLLLKQRIAVKKEKTQNPGKRSLKDSGITYEKGANQVGQTVIIFPTLWSLYQSTTAEQRKSKGVGVSHSRSTNKQKADMFRAIKQGSVHTVLCTYSQLFQDWKNITSILLKDQHARWYKNQQDPRYYLPTVIDQLAALYGAQVTKSGFVLEMSQPLNGTPH